MAANFRRNSTLFCDNIPILRVGPNGPVHLKERGMILELYRCSPAGEWWTARPEKRVSGALPAVVLRLFVNYECPLAQVCCRPVSMEVYLVQIMWGCIVTQFR